MQNEPQKDNRVSPSDQSGCSGADAGNKQPDQGDQREPAVRDVPATDDYDDYYPNDEGDGRCTYCDGEGWGIVGCDWDSDDPINGPYPGEIEQCPNCRGSGKAEDMWFW